MDWILAHLRGIFTIMGIGYFFYRLEAQHEALLTIASNLEGIANNLDTIADNLADRG